MARTIDPTATLRDDPTQPLVPILKGDDQIIVEIDFHLPPRQLAMFRWDSTRSGGRRSREPAGAVAGGSRLSNAAARAALLQQTQSQAPAIGRSRRRQK